jgi:D-alanyl-D-alanine carboxypeptidase
MAKGRSSAPSTWRLLSLLAMLALVAACSGGVRPALVDERPQSLTPNSIPDAPAPPPPPGTPPSTTTTSVVEEPAPSREWTLLAGGDVLMDRTEAAGIDPFAFIEPSLASADITVVNAEMAISDRGSAVNKEYVFRAPPQAAERIAAAGIDVANLANNHARDYGADALLDSVRLLETAGVVALGAGADDSAAYAPWLLHTAGGVRVAFVGASAVLPPEFAAGPEWPGIAAARPTARVVESVRAASGAADVVIVTIHWGIERQTCPTGEQVDIARELLDAGADAVIGHHPHVLQPVEIVDGKLVAYSLGNFVWHPRSGLTGETGVLQIDFDADRIIGWAFHPHLLDENGAPRPVGSGPRFDRIREIIAGDCARHTPPPAAATPTTEPDTPEPDTSGTDTPEPDTSGTGPEVTEPDTPEPTTPEPDTPEPDRPEPDTSETGTVPEETESDDAGGVETGAVDEPSEDAVQVAEPRGGSNGSNESNAPTDASLVNALGSLAARAPTGGCLAVSRAGETVFARNAEAMLIPASLQKLPLAAAALEILGADYTFTTAALAESAPSGGVLAGDLYLVGGGDPLLSTPDFAAMLAGHRSTGTPLADLANDLVAAGLTDMTGGVVAVADRYDTLTTVPDWPARFAAQSIAGSLSAVSVNQGWRAPPGLTTTWGLLPVPAPALRAAEIFDDLLEARSVRIPLFPRVAAAGGDYSRHVVLASVESAPLAANLHYLLAESDNTLAEMLLKEIGVVRRGSGSTAAGAQAVQEVLAPKVAGFAVPADGSGLSPDNRMSCHQVTRVLELGGLNGHVGANLGVAGRSGTMENRYRNSPAAGLVRGKTGTLDGVAALAGFAEAASGDVFSFAVILNSGSDWIDNAAAARFFAELLEILVGATGG